MFSRTFGTRFFTPAAISCATGLNYWYSRRSEQKLEDSKPLWKNFRHNFLTFTARAFSEEDLGKKLYAPDLKTDVYVWGNGVVLNNEMDYTNYYPKKIRAFSKDDSPVIVSVKFGSYHEAYLDAEGKVHICRKHELPSKKIQGVNDGDRGEFQTFEVEGEQLVDIQFTSNRMFGLTASGKVYLWIIYKEAPKVSSGNLSEMADELFLQDGESEKVAIDSTPYHIKELGTIVSIKTGENHFLSLDEDGVMWAMGDDTYGQCGQFVNNRPLVPPFKDIKISKPQRVNCHEQISKIACGHRHCLAATTTGRLFAWGYNHQVQISHGEDLASASSQKLVLYEPTVIHKEISMQKVTQMDGGSDFSIILSENSSGDQFFWATGNNLRGQLGINTTTHYHDMEPMYFEDEPIEPVKFEFLSCGRRHSIIALEEGGLLVWGDNEVGQIGNKNRRVVPRPFLRPRFSRGEKIIDVECSGDNSAVVIERPKRKAKKKVKKEPEVIAEPEVQQTDSDSTPQEPTQTSQPSP
ncbi:unnamed protein product [Moneuplotes crassus]|uniref:RCC1-like domain-containing protein n=1 Tax=Euplotes crassus TaxID=5936 RepID=A0AAD1XBY5_EUPCR|nr:unnamed protein product [Moneuplotes crassus]